MRSSKEEGGIVFLKERSFLHPNFPTNVFGRWIPGAFPCCSLLPLPSITFVGLLIKSCVNAACVCTVCACVCVWRPGADVSCLPLFLSSFCFLSLFLTSLFCMCECVCVCVCASMYDTAPAWRSGDSLQESVPSLHHVGLGIELRSLCLAARAPTY